MEKRQALTDAEGEVRELTAADLAGFRPAAEVLPPALRKTLGLRGAQKAPLKRVTTLRVDADVLERWRASGKGWQTRAAALLAAKAPKLPK